MSSSKGKVVDLYDVLEVYQPELVRYLFAGTRPNTEFSISFDLDVIKTYEDYDKTERIAWGVEKAKNEQVYAKERRVYELSQVDGMPSIMPYQMGFRHLCNLLQTASGDIDAVIANLTDIKEEQIGRFKERCICAWNWIRECSPEDFRFSLRSNGEKIALEDAELKALQRVAEEVLPQVEVLEEKPLSQLLYDIAKDEGIEPKALFTVLYQALIEKDQGPRLASFMKIIGKEKLQTLLSIYT